MVFPETPLGLRGEVRLGTTWTNITGDLYTRDPITHTRGRKYRANAAEPAECTATIKNLGGKWTPRNAEGENYGLFGRNTPFQISLPAAAPYLASTDSVVNSGSIQTPDDAALDITGDLDVRFDATLRNWLAAGSVELCGKGQQGGNQRSWLLLMRNGRLHFEWSTAGTSTLAADSTLVLPAWPGRRMAVRVTLDVDNGASGRTITFYYATTIAGPWTQLGDPVVQAGTTSIFASTAVLLVGNGWLDLAFPRPNGMIHAAEVRNGINGTVVANPDLSIQTPGATTFTDSSGRTWTVGGSSTITDRIIRFSGEIPEWPSKWAKSAKDAWTPVQAAGILRRLSQGAKTLQSTLRRSIPSFAPLAYWPMEEGFAASQASSPIAGVPPLRLSSANWAAVDSLPSSSPLPTIDSATSVRCDLQGRVPVPKSPLTAWSVRFLYRLDTPNTTQRTVLRILSTGTVAEWYIQHLSTDNSSNIVAKDADGNTLFTQAVTLGTSLYNRWYVIDLQVSQSGSNVTWHLGYIEASGPSVGLDFSYVGQIGRPTAVASPPNGYATELDGMALGHITVWGEANNSAFTGALNAWAGETAGARLLRLSGEEGVPLTIVGNPAETELVGPQRPKTLLDLLRECADADGGTLGEARDRRELTYRTRTSIYNQPPKLVLDYAARQLVTPLEPIDDDTVRNDWTVQRDGGSSGNAVLAEGALSVQDPPAGIGLYDDSVTLNLYSDAQTDPIASWLVHQYTWDESRYPAVTVRLHQNPELIPDVLALDVGDKIRIVNLPKQYTGSGVVELLVDGWTEVFRPRAWDITFNCAPAGPWTVAETAIVEDFEDTDYAVSLSSGGNLPWTRSQLHNNTGTWSLRSGAITDNQTSDAIIGVPAGATSLTFWYWVSSESSGPGFEGDRLLVLVDGVQVLRAQGTVGWTPATIAVSGANAVTFRYTKDASAATGEDAAHIDDLTFTRAPMRVDTDGSQLAAAASSTTTSLSVATSSGPLWVTSAAHPEEFPFDVAVGGERVQVTAITGATSPQTFTVVRSVNGVVKTQTAGTAVHLADPAIIAL